MSSDLASFQQYLVQSTRILALVGAGLSAGSGLPTFRGAGGYWRNFEAMDLATPDAFQDNPSLVWQFYAARRSAALKAKPNMGHYALAELSRRKKGFLTLSQNVDGLSSRANHPDNQLLLLHGDLFTVKCTSFLCSFSQQIYEDPLTPALASCDDLNKPVKNIPISELPHCPSCHTGLLRPGIVWFGESLPLSVVTKAEEFLSAGKVDLILVIGTSGSVWPAAGYVETVLMKGGKAAIFNTEVDDEMDSDQGWVFRGDAAEWLPKALEPVIGKLKRRKL